MAEFLPPSPTFSDAVTASEGGEQVTQDDHSPEMRSDGTTDLRDIVTSYPTLGTALSEFLEKIAPWKGIMPENLVRQMGSLEGIAAKMRQAGQQIEVK